MSTWHAVFFFLNILMSVTVAMKVVQRSKIQINLDNETKFSIFFAITFSALSIPYLLLILVMSPMWAFITMYSSLQILSLIHKRKTKKKKELNNV